MIREKLDIPPDDTQVVQHWIKKGVNSNSIDTSVFKKYSKGISFAAAPHLQEYASHLDRIDRSTTCIVTADGATRFLLNEGIIPDLVVSDLDGITNNDILLLLDNNVIIQILVHGDNKSRFQDLIDEIDVNQYKNIVCSTQGPPINGWENTMGFTDGDRAVCLLAKHIDYIYMAGYDLRTNKIGKYSKPQYKDHQPMTKSKRKKLEIAQTILRWVNHHHTIYSQNYLMAPGVELPFDEFLRI